MKKLFSVLVLVFSVLAVSCQSGGESIEDGEFSAIKFVSQDGKAYASNNGLVEESRVVLNFIVTPTSAIANITKNWKKGISCSVVCDNTSLQLPILNYRSSTGMGIISLTISCSTLPEAFFKESAEAIVNVSVSDGEVTVVSDPILLLLGEFVEEYNSLQVYPRENEVKVMSFNVRVESSEVDSSNNWSNRKAACVALIKEHQPCLIGFQEAKFNSQWSYFKEQLKDEYDGWGVNRDTGKESGSGEVMGILYNKSRIEKIEGGTFWLSETPDKCSYGWDAACRRTATWGVFRHKATDKCFLYVNTHLDHQGTTARIKGVEQLANFFGRYSSYAGILSGDMNIESTHDAFKVLAPIMNNTRDVAPKGRTDTHTTYNAYTTSSQSIIDHIYCSKSMQVIEYHTVSENYGVKFVSDHYPIYAIISL